jgi:hypothetical protein
MNMTPKEVGGLQVLAMQHGGSSALLFGCRPFLKP